MSTMHLTIYITSVLSIGYFAVSEDNSPQVTVEQGALKGIKMTSSLNREYFAFFGIPYAKPPIGELRFKAPKPSEKWDGIYDATEERNVCPQMFIINGVYKGNEDCLYLNIFTNKLPKIGDNLTAVMVFIHGGAFMKGSASNRLLGPDYLIEKDVVLVTIQYRLGLLGFLSVPDACVPGNNGLKDQVTALRWLQKNVAMFGGDPNKVTIFGESAGGASVHYQILSPLSKGLFHAAISQSGVALNPWAYKESEDLQKLAFEKASKLGCNTTDPKELIQFLKKCSPEDLVAEEGFEIHWAPTCETPCSNEETFLSEKPGDVVSGGKFSPVPFMLGVNKYESALFLGKINFTCDNKDEECLIRIMSSVPKFANMEHKKKGAVIQKVKNGYFKNNTSFLDGKIDLLSDIMFGYGTYKTVKKYQEVATPPCFNYNFEVDGDLALTRMFHLDLPKRPTHSDEIPYLFSNIFTPELDEESVEIKTSKRMCKMWTNFAKTGDPTSELDSLLKIKWKAVTKTGNEYLCIDNELSMQYGLNKDRMELLEEIETMLT